MTDKDTATAELERIHDMLARWVEINSTPGARVNLIRDQLFWSIRRMEEPFDLKTLRANLAEAMTDRFTQEFPHHFWGLPVAPFLTAVFRTGLEALDAQDLRELADAQEQGE